MLELDVKIDSKDLYDYMMAHTYNSASGIIGSCVGALMVVGGLANSKWIFVIFGAIVLLYLPWNLFLKSKQQALTNPAFKNSLHYVLDENGITVSQGEESQNQAWENMYKAVSTNRSIIIYTSPVNATILPRRALGENVTDCIRIISAHMPPKKVKIRF
ncbi:MAG: YcxB family protein [Lachnospiraceae bacterium]|nr:YcxB family protein [Lachnospiraceae bacterium]